METYPWKSIDPKDELQIESLDSLTSKDVHVLTKLYQPLIGAQAYALYMSLFAYLDFQNTIKQTTVSEVLRKLDIGIPDFFQARIKLEGIGLLGIYRSKENQNQYIYEIVAPMPAEEFFKDSLLRTLLLEKIGQRLFEEEMGALLSETSSKVGYEETTRSFVDVYNFAYQNASQLSQADSIAFDTPRRAKVSKTIDQMDSFDYTFFKQGLDSHFVSPESLTREIREMMYTYHVVYGIDEMAMPQLILESADIGSGRVDAKKFRRLVEIQYSNQQKAKKMKREATQNTTKFETTQLEGRGFNSAEISIIKHAKTAPPAKYLESIKDQKKGFVTQDERYVLKDLVEKSPLSVEVINILINYILVVQNNVVLDKRYTMKIANDWAQSDVNTAEDAIAKIKNVYSEAQAPKPKGQGGRTYSNYNRRPIQKEKLPDWAKKENQDTQAADQVKADEQGESIQDRIERLQKLRELKEGN